MKFLELRTSEIASSGCQLTAALFGGILTTPDSNTWSASYDVHTLFRSSRVQVPTVSRAALNYECKVARAHARVCWGLATPLDLPCMLIFLLTVFS